MRVCNTPRKRPSVKEGSREEWEFNREGLKWGERKMNEGKLVLRNSHKKHIGDSYHLWGIAQLIYFTLI